MDHQPSDKLLTKEEIVTCVEYAIQLVKIKNVEEKVTKISYVIASVEHMRKILKKAVELMGDCRADHHGYCQAHNLEPIEECWVNLARKALPTEKKG